MNLISIIIPMYNEQDNIENCIDVLKNQSNQNFEVLFVDDGSRDSTLAKLKHVLASDVNFKYKVIEQENKGAAEARKTGIQSSSSDFLMFLDCDDKLSTDMVQEVYNKYAKDNNVDIIIPKMHIQDAAGNWRDFSFYTNDMILQSKDCVKNSLNGWAVHGCFAIKKSIINKSYEIYRGYNLDNINYINNDEVITRLNFSNSKNIVRSEAGYYYCYNDSSTTNSINDKRYLTIQNALILNEIFSNDKELSVSVKSELIAVLWSNFLYMRQHKSELSNIEEWKKVIANGLNQLNYVNTLNEMAIKKKIQLTLLKLTYKL